MCIAYILTSVPSPPNLATSKQIERQWKKGKAELINKSTLPLLSSRFIITYLLVCVVLIFTDTLGEDRAVRKRRNKTKEKLVS